MLYQYSKKDIKEAVKAAMKKEFLSEMESSVKVSDRLSEDPEDNSYINNMSLPKARVWIRFRARAIAGSVLLVLKKLKNIYSFVGGRGLKGGGWIYLTRGDYWTSGGG